jgi:hypothetical protein
MKKLFGFALVLAGSAMTCAAGLAAVPEIDPAAGVSALALISGGLLVIRARRRK